MSPSPSVLSLIFSLCSILLHCSRINKQTAQKTWPHTHTADCRPQYVYHTLWAIFLFLPYRFTLDQLVMNEGWIFKKWITCQGCLAGYLEHECICMLLARPPCEMQMWIKCVHLLCILDRSLTIDPMSLGILGHQLGPHLGTTLRPSFKLLQYRYIMTQSLAAFVSPQTLKACFPRQKYRNAEVKLLLLEVKVRWLICVEVG